MLDYGLWMLANNHNTHRPNTHILFRAKISKKKHVFYNLEPNSKVEKEILLKNFSYPKNDAYAFKSFAFFSDVFYYHGQGIIDPPFGLLENKYHFFIWNKGMSSKLRPDGWQYNPPLKNNRQNLQNFNY